MASVSCAFCHNPVNPHDIGTWKKVSGWVHGPKRDSMTMREDTGEYAHTHCILKAKAGQPVDQQEMFEAVTQAQVYTCDSCMRQVTRSEVHDFADGEHVICKRCVSGKAGHDPVEDLEKLEDLLDE